MRKSATPLLRFFWPVIGGVFALIVAGFASLDFSLPKTLWGDHTFLLIVAKNMMSHGLLWSNVDLGRPGVFSMYAFPLPDLSQHAILRLCTLVTSNPFRASNYYYVLVILFTYWSAFFALWKFLRSVALSLIGGWLFLFVPYLACRSTGHDYLAAYYAAPWAYIVCREIAQSVDGKPVSCFRELLSFLGKWEVLLGSVIIGFSGVYYLAFSLILLCIYSLVIAVTELTQQSKLPSRLLLKCGSVILLCLGFFSLALYPSLHFLKQHHLHLPQRGFMEQIIVGTKIADLLWTASLYLPSSRSIDGYMAQRVGEGFDFWPGIVLSVVALLNIIFYPLWWKDRSRSSTEKSIKAVLVFMTFALLFTMPYGIGLIFNVLVTSAIRSQARISPFFAFGAIIVFGYQLRWIFSPHGDVDSPGVKAEIKIAFVLLLLTTVNGWPCLGFYSQHQRQLLENAMYQKETQSLQSVLNAIHDRGLKQIVQLPIAPWPEAAKQLNFDPYDHLLPYIYDTLPCRTSWSYGLMSHDPQFGVLQRASEAQPTKLIAKNFLCLGFDGVLIEKSAYTAAELVALDAALLATHLAHNEYEDDKRLLLSLRSPGATNVFCDKTQ